MATDDLSIWNEENKRIKCKNYRGSSWWSTRGIRNLLGDLWIWLDLACNLSDVLKVRGYGKMSRLVTIGAKLLIGNQMYYIIKEWSWLVIRDVRRRRADKCHGYRQTYRVSFCHVVRPRGYTVNQIGHMHNTEGPLLYTISLLKGKTETVCWLLTKTLMSTSVAPVCPGIPMLVQDLLLWVDFGADKVKISSNTDISGTGLKFCWTSSTLMSNTLSFQVLVYG